MKGGISLDTTEAVRRLQSGDQSAFDDLYTAYADPAIRTAYLITRSQSTAEDAVQDAFVQVLRNVHSLRDPTAFRPWFYRILINSAKRIARTGPAYIVRLDLENHDKADATHPTPDEFAVTAEEVDELRVAISELNEVHRVPVYLRYFAGLSEQEIAVTLDLPPGTVKSRLYNARRMLQERLVRRKTMRVPGRVEGVTEA